MLNSNFSLISINTKSNSFDTEPNTLYHYYFVPNPFALITSLALLGMDLTKIWTSPTEMFSTLIEQQFQVHFTFFGGGSLPLILLF